MNDGSPTRINRGTGGLSSPDITLCHPDLIPKIDWACDSYMGSDHIAIIISVNAYVKVSSAPTARKRWRRTGVDWTAFAEAVDSELDSFVPHSHGHSTSTLSTFFQKCLLRAAEKHVGKTRHSNSSRSWLTPDVRAAIRRRNLLRRNIHLHRREWIDACAEVKKKVLEAKEKSWSEFLDQVAVDPDPSKVWRVIRSLSGTPSSRSPNEALEVNGRIITSNKKKADLFCQQYAAVCRLTFTRQERARNRLAKGLLRRPDLPGPECQPFSFAELKTALRATRAGGAPGEDDIPPSFLLALSERALHFLLSLLNRCWTSTEVPQAWRNSLIVPILKAGKPPNLPSSYRPISLTSCVGKTLERLITTRLLHLAETRGWLSECQAGFRPGRSCEDALLSLTQQVSDAFQLREKTLFAQLDYSKAFDRVWHQELLITLHETGVPPHYCRWISSFLSNRQGRVLYNGEVGRRRRFHHGVPQGSVLSPLLFIMYTNSITRIIPAPTHIALYADDTSLWASSRSKEEAAAKVQDALTAIAAWSRSKKLTLNSSKSECILFTNNSSEAAWKPPLTINGESLHFNPHPRLLGITLDRTLCFQAHSQASATKVSMRCRALAAMTSNSWGNKKHVLLRLYHTFARPCLDYCAAAWQPYLSATSYSTLERAHNKGLRVATGQLRTTPIEAIRKEANCPSYTTISRRLTTLAYEKSLRLPISRERHSIAARNVRHRLTRPSWRSTAAATVKNIVPDERLPLPHPPKPPWSTRHHQWTAAADIPDLPPASSPEDTRRLAALRLLESLKHSVLIFTDGSASDGTRDGGAAAVVCSGPPASPIARETVTAPGAKWTSSFEEELRALNLALQWIHANRPPSVAICTDSQSLVKALSGPSRNSQRLRDLLEECPCEIHLQWVPSHCGIPGNELADQAAKTATNLPGPRPATSLAATKCLLWRAIQDPPTAHTRTNQTYISPLSSHEKSLPREDGVLLAQLRSGHCMRLAAYRNIVRPEEDPTCPHCHLAPQTVEHWLLDCPALRGTRQRVFNGADPSLSISVTSPKKVLQLARLTL